MSLSTFTIAWNSFIFIWTRLALLGAGPIFATFSLPFWTAGFQMGRQTFQELYRGLVSTEFTISKGKFRLVKDIQSPSFISKLKSSNIVGRLRNRISSKVSNKLKRPLNSVRKLARKEVSGSLSNLRIGDVVEISSNVELENSPKGSLHALEIFIPDENNSMKLQSAALGEGLSLAELSKLRELLINNAVSPIIIDNEGYRNTKV